jgi:prophage regulatory protein
VTEQLSILRRKAVEARVGLSKSSLYEAIKKHQFPKPVSLGPRAVGWLESEITLWIAQRAEQRN